VVVDPPPKQLPVQRDMTPMAGIRTGNGVR